MAIFLLKCPSCSGKLSKPSILSNFISATLHAPAFLVKGFNYFNRTIIDNIESNGPVMVCVNCKHLITFCPYCKEEYKTPIDLTNRYGYTEHVECVSKSIQCPSCNKVSIVCVADTLPKII